MQVSGDGPRQMEQELTLCTTTTTAARLLALILRSLSHWSTPAPAASKRAPASPYQLQSSSDMNIEPRRTDVGEFDRVAPGHSR